MHLLTSCFSGSISPSRRNGVYSSLESDSHFALSKLPRECYAKVAVTSFTVPSPVNGVRDFSAPYTSPGRLWIVLLNFPFDGLNRVAFFFARIPAIPPNGCKTQVVCCIRVVTAVLAFLEGLFPLGMNQCLLCDGDAGDFIFTHCYSFGWLYDTTNSAIYQFAGLLVGV